MDTNKEHRWGTIQRNQADQVFIHYFALLEKPEIFFMESSVQEMLIVAVVQKGLLMSV